MNYDKLDPVGYESRHERSPREAYLHAHWAPRFDAAFREVAVGRVLELGCGAGAYTGALTGAKEVVAIDLSQRFLERVVFRYPEVKLARADAHHLPFAETTFDAVVSVGILEYLDHDRAFAEIVRVLRPNGRLVIAAPNRHSLFRASVRAIQRATGRVHTCHEPTRSEIARLCARHGLVIEHVDMSDTLIWLPDAVDRRIGRVVYRWLAASIANLPAASRISSVMLVRARKAP
jgi:SAM-dependent methyltransferase